jgi:hypothetical protein
MSKLVRAALLGPYLTAAAMAAILTLPSRTGDPGRFNSVSGSRSYSTRLDLGVRYPPYDRNQALRRAVEHLSSINKSLSLALFPGWILAMLAPVLAADGIKIDDLVIAGRIPAARREATVKAVRAFTHQFPLTRQQGSRQRRHIVCDACDPHLAQRGPRSVRHRRGIT